MPLQNRVDAWGRLRADPSKAGTLMGNRGILHNAERTIVKPWERKPWVACDPHYDGIDRRPLFQPHRYSELFFLDEATAFAAGHRPCAYCQRVRFGEFKSAWASKVGASRSSAELRASDIDAKLHQERAIRGGGKVTFTSRISDLPDGTMVEYGGAALLLNRGSCFRWSFTGYSKEPLPANDPQVAVLTPRSIVRIFASGFDCRVHDSASPL